MDFSLHLKCSVKVGTPNSALDLELSKLLIPIIAQNLEHLVHIDQDDLNKINIYSLHSFRTFTKKNLNPCNFCIQYPNYAFFSALESSCICQSEYLKYYNSNNRKYAHLKI
jgi:hypothetical protein